MSRVMLILAVLVCVAAYAGPNLYPDPSFETSGVTGVARTGTHAAYLSVDAPNHWAAFGGEMKLQPFARYRLSEWVKANVSKGQFFAPHIYAWDSYEWAFSASKPVNTLGEWTQTEVTFVCPVEAVSVHPLAYIDSEKSEGWADDIVLEKIAEPEEVMAELIAKPAPTDVEKKILVRWHVAKGDMAKATALLEGAGGLTLADLATVVAGAIKDPAERQPYLVDVLVGGGPTYYEGMKTFQRIAAGLSPQQQAALAIEALKRNPNDARTGRSAQMILTGTTLTDPLATVGEGLAQAGEQRKTLEEAIAALPAGATGATELQGALAKVTDAEAGLRSRQGQLGKCKIVIGGMALDASKAAIAVPNEATPSEQYAARDLRYHLELITGQLFPIVSERTKLMQAIYVGKTEKAKAAGVKLETLGLEGLQAKTVKNSVILAGNQRGVLYATYEFLENTLGCRWFTPECSTWPTRGTINVTALDKRYIPPLEFRAGDYPIARAGDFAVRLRLNGNNHQMTAEQGGRKGVHGLAHTFQALVPPERYFAEHPEYFSLVGGKRQSGYAQLCLTNPEVLRISIEGVRNWIKQNPDMKVFSVSQNDTANYCECENCTAIAEAEGSQAGPVIRFCNAIADDIKDEYPEVAIETLAYQYTRKPPKLTKPRDNVIICLCSIECCFIHPLGSDPFNKTFADDIRGWSKICDRLWIWDYIINYAHSICPFPNMEVLKPNVQFFLDNGVKGIYEESCYYTKGSELQELRNYVMAKALWDPKVDTQKATEEFCKAFYGAAAPQVLAYLDLIHKSVLEAPKLHVTIYTHPKQYVFPEVITRSAQLFDEAEAAVAKEPVLLHRVQVARLPIMYAQITLASSGTFVEKDGALVQEEGEDVGTLVDKFGEIARKEGVTSIREGGGDLEAWLGAVPRQPRQIKIEQIGNPALKLEVLPDLGGRIFRMTYVPANRQLLRVGGTATAVSPAEGGYEEYSEGGYRSPGWSEAYIVKERTERSLLLETGLRNGLRISRRVELDPEKAIVNITTTATNVGKAAVAACLRSHPEFAVTSTEKAQLRVLGAGGKWQTINLANPADPKAEKDQWLRQTDLPQGTWVLVDGGADLAIINRFEQGDVAQALVNRAGQQSRVNLELFGKEVTLEPGQSVSLRQSFEVGKAGNL